jgi:hypothetical protein
MDLAVFCEIVTDLFNTLTGKTYSYTKYIRMRKKRVFLMTGADLREVFKIFKGQDTKYRTIILSVVLYGCETWSLTLREEGRLRVFENRVLRVFGPKRAM